MIANKAIAVTACLAVALVAPLAAQGGPRGSGQGFGMRSWVLQQGGVDSIAAIIDLTEEQRSQLDELARSFHEENAAAIERMNQMRAEIDALWTDVQRPRREAMEQIAEKYSFPEQDLRPALTRFHSDVAGIITVQQQTQLQRNRSLSRRSHWNTVGRAYRGGQRGFASRRGFNQSRSVARGGRGGMRAGRTGQMQRLRLHRRPPIEP